MLAVPQQAEAPVPIVCGTCEIKSYTRNFYNLEQRDNHEVWHYHVQDYEIESMLNIARGDNMYMLDWCKRNPDYCIIPDKQGRTTNVGRINRKRYIFKVRHLV